MRHALNIITSACNILNAIGGMIFFFSLFQFYIPIYYLPVSIHDIQKQSKLKNTLTRSKVSGYASKKDERSVLKSMLKRADKSKSVCKFTISQNRHVNNTLNDVQLKPGGIVDAIRQWIHSTNEQHNVCRLPPAKSCNTKAYTIIIMAHNTDRFKKLGIALKEVFFKWKGATEIVLVWNAPRTDLLKKSTNTTDNSYSIIKDMLQWNVNPTHPFRIFYSFEHGLTNNLLNRYHPSIAPINEMLIYFDDDGPFYTTSKLIIKSGIELWKRNSNIQIGNYGRRVAFTDERITTQLDNVLEKTVQQAITNDMKQNKDNFVPFCRNDNDGEYEYTDSKADFGSHIILPTGSIIHRNYLCFIWHPAFDDEARQFVSEHITKPDDMFVSLLIAHLSDRGPKLYPRKKYVGYIKGLNKSNTINEVSTNHRRLLWENTEGWFQARTDAANSLMRYFGSIPPPSVGWCVGSPYLFHNGSRYECSVDYPKMEMLPWMNDWGPSYHQCPKKKWKKNNSQVETQHR